MPAFLPTIRYPYAPGGDEFQIAGGTLVPGAPTGGYLNVNFSPKNGGIRRATLVLTDPLTNVSLAELELSGMGKPGVSLALDKLELDIPVFGSATANLSLGSLNLPDPPHFTLSALGLPDGVTFTCSSPSVTSLPAQVGVTFSAPGRVASLPVSGPGGAGAILACGLLAAPFARRRKPGAGWPMALVLAFALGLAACSGSSSGTGTVTAPRRQATLVTLVATDSVTGLELGRTGINLVMQVK